jgi:quercetin dioxygenase-like cupin family protein
MRPVPLHPLAANAGTPPADWFLDILRIIPVDGADTGGRYCLMEQLMPEGAGPTPHVHPYGDEYFYPLDGAMRMEIGGDTIEATAGGSVWVPCGTVHAFKVTTETCRVINSFAPAGMEQVTKALARPAERRALPPKGLATDPQGIAAFANNYWGVEERWGFAHPPWLEREPAYPRRP